MHALLDEPRLAAFAGSPEPVVFARIARDWAASVPAHRAAIRDADGEALPEALHELRSGAVAVGLPLLAATLAGIEQRAERGTPPAAGEIDAALALADRSAAELLAWWDRAGVRG
ncbi:MAG: hypothetical protein U0237_04025 [Thermoleophilia bacterium]